MVIDALLPEDLPAAIRLWQATDGIGLSEEETPEMLARFLERNPQLSSAAWEGDALTGAVLAGHDDRRAFLYHLAVRADRRGQGIGRALVERSLEGLRQAEIARAGVMVYADNEAGRQFWSGLGWQPRGDLCFLQLPL